MATPGRARARVPSAAREATRLFAQGCLTPWVVKIERAFKQAVLGPRYDLSINMDSLLRGALSERDHVIGAE